MLLAAGYFRARIPKLHPFDKMLGGLAWCIISSNVEVDVDLHFDEDMTLGMCWQGIEDVFLNHSVRYWFFSVRSQNQAWRERHRRFEENEMSLTSSAPSASWTRFSGDPAHICKILNYY
jgi:hypothetical protein